MSKQVGLAAVGAAAPKKILTNFDLEKLVDTNDEWIVTRTGIKERHILEPGEGILGYIVESAQMACERSDFSPKDLDFIISSTLTPDRISPAQAFDVANVLGVENPFCFDVNAACSGLMYGLAIAESLLKTRDISYGLVTAGEQTSRIVDFTDRSSCVLFGDGAAALLVTNDNPAHPILATEIGADPSMAEEVFVGGVTALLNNKLEDYYFRQNGKTVFKFAVNKIKELYETVPKKAGVRPQDIKYFIPHQANIRIIEAAGKEMTEAGTEIITNIDRYGNTSSASIGLALNEAYERFQPGDLILMAGFGAGLSWGSALIQW